MVFFDFLLYRCMHVETKGHGCPAIRSHESLLVTGASGLLAMYVELGIPTGLTPLFSFLIDHRSDL